MNSQIQTWCTRSWDFLGKLPGNVGSELCVEWRAHAEAENLRVTFLGPYGAGKSSLLKRLLVDSGQSIPEGLTISARRETFEVCEVHIEGLTVRDTPGLAGGNLSHEQAALESLPSSDVIIVVLPPQTVTSEKALLVSIMDGSWFGCSSLFAYAPNGCAVVLSRMDEAGVDPRVSVAEYKALVGRKVVELRNLLGEVPESLISVHAVCADPGQLINNAKPEGRHEYDAGREWDGMSQFFDFLKGLPGRKEELRRHSEVRFLCFKMLELSHELRGLAAETDAGVKEWQHEASAHCLSIERLNALLDSARADLSRCIEEEMASAARRGATDPVHFKEQFSAKLYSGFQRWADNHEAALQKLLSETDSERQRRWERPSFENLMKSLSADSPNTAPQDKTSTGGGRRMPYQRIATGLKKGTKEFLEWRTGMPMKKAAEEVRQLKSAGSFEKYLSRYKGAAPLRDVKHADFVKKAVNATKFLDVAVPIMVELGPLLGDFIGDAMAIQRRRERRENIRVLMTESAENFQKEAWRLWCDEGVPGAALKAFEEQQRSSAEAAENLCLEFQNLNSKVNGLESLLAEAGYKMGS